MATPPRKSANATKCRCGKPARRYEYTQVGRDSQSPVTDDYVGDSKYNGKIHWVEMEGGQDSHAHLIDPETIFQYAMAKQ